MGNKPSLSGTSTSNGNRSNRISRVDLKSAFASFAGSNGEEAKKRKDTSNTEQSRDDKSGNDTTAEERPAAADDSKPTITPKATAVESVAVQIEDKVLQPTLSRPQQQMPAPATVPCQYRTGKTLGSGTYAIVKEAVHITTGKYYACKVINKRLMEGREHMVRNEIAVLKRVSSGHPNIVTLHDYFETSHNLYLCFDLCTGGELFDRICAKGNYYEADAASLIRTIFKAVKYVHDCGIVHRDLKPENLLFRTAAEDADIMIADFGLSRVMEQEKMNLLTEICGTPGYMAPEIFLRSGHGKPVDVWAMGVITYFLLAGYTPFDRDTQQQEMQAIIAGDYRFEPEEYWQNVSKTAKDFVTVCLTVDPAKRPTADEVLQHKWLADEQPHFVPDPTRDDGHPTDLLPNVKKAFNAKKLWRKATSTIRAVNRMATLVHVDHHAVQMREKLTLYKEESEKENLEHAHVTFQSESAVKTDEPSPTQEISIKMANATLQSGSLGKASQP